MKNELMAGRNTRVIPLITPGNDSGKVTFQKVVLHGWKLENTVLKFRNGDSLVEAKTSETATEEFSKTFILAEPVTPDAMRFEFGGKMVEIFELEVF